MNRKNRNIRDLYRAINEFKRDYQPRSILVKDENGDLLADSNTTVNRWKSYFSQLLNVHNVSDVRQLWRQNLLQIILRFKLLLQAKKL
jgi:hypothetical protein